MATYNAIPPSSEGLDPYSPAFGRYLSTPSENPMTQLNNRAMLRALSAGGADRYAKALESAQIHQAEGQKNADTADTLRSIIAATGSIFGNTGRGAQYLTDLNPSRTQEQQHEAAGQDTIGGDLALSTAAKNRAEAIDKYTVSGYGLPPADAGAFAFGDKSYGFKPIIPPVQAASMYDADQRLKGEKYKADHPSSAGGDTIIYTDTGVKGAPVQTQRKVRVPRGVIPPPGGVSGGTPGAPAPGAPDAAPQQADARGGTAEPPLYTDPSAGLVQRPGPDGKLHWYPRT
jgi:hypothetical protein